MRPEVLRALDLGDVFEVLAVHSAMPGVLAIPDRVLLDRSGRAIAWIVGRPFVVHPSLADLLELHGLAVDVAARAA
jgi:hypothetical protein